MISHKLWNVLKSAEAEYASELMSLNSIAVRT